MKKNETTILIILLIVIVIIIGLIILLINLNNNNSQDNLEYSDGVISNPDLEGTYGNVTYNNEVSNIITRYDYYNVKYCAEKYQESINELINNKNDENKLKLYQMLDEQYINAKDISENNIDSIFSNYQISNIYIDKILSTQLSDSVKAYVAKGKTITNNVTNDCVIIIKLDFANNTFSVYPYEYVLEEGYNNLEVGSNLNIQNVNSITVKGANVYEDQSNSVESIAILYYEKLKVDFLYDSEYLYSILDEEYRNKRFENYEDFTNYTDQVRDIISNGTVTKYSREYYDGYVQYLVIDSYDNRYIFNENSVLNYTVLLDDYTIETEDFKTKYASASVETKAITNVDKVMKMINSKDYRAIYNLLDETYKANNFATLDSFIQYINTAFYNVNYYTISNISEQGSYYLITVACKENASASADTKENRMIISIGEGTNFTMSFALE